MDRPDAIFYSIAFYSYLAGFFVYIANVASKKEFFGKIATLIMAIGCVPHSIAFFMRWSMKGHVPLANMYEYMGIMSWMVVLGLLYFSFRFKNHRLGVFVSPIAVMLLVVASLLPSDVNKQLMPALQSTWLAIHVSMAALGSGAFLIAFSASTLFLLTKEDNNISNNNDSKEWWKLFIVYWFAIPVLVSIILNFTSLIPQTLSQVNQHQGHSGSAITAFTLRFGGNTYFPGRIVIGLGIGMVIGSILWPLLKNRIPALSNFKEKAGKYFALHVLGLLISAVIVGFLIKYEHISVTSRSYFKIFEFFGPVLMISWILIPLVSFLFLGKRGEWLSNIGVSSKITEDLSYSAVAVGYPLYTIGALFAGAIWAEQAWGTWWSWDPKEVGALVIWLFYTGFLHARFQKQWKGEKAAMLVILGMVFVFVSFFGNYFFGGMHSFEVG